jgi:hypothetical protein
MIIKKIYKHQLILSGLLTVVLFLGARSLGAAEKAADLRTAGFITAFSLSNLWLPHQKTPLAYTPLEMGYAFKNGWQLRAALDLFFYQGPDPRLKEPLPDSVVIYSYEMTSWRLMGLYQVPFDFWIRPLLGLGIEQSGGNAYIKNEIEGKAQAAYGYQGLTTQAGFDVLISSRSNLAFWGRWLIPFGDFVSVPQAGISFVYILR